MRLSSTLSAMESAPDSSPCLLEISGDAPVVAWTREGVGPRLLAWGERLARLAGRRVGLRVAWADGAVRGPALELLLTADLILLDHAASLVLFPPAEGYFPVAGGLTRALRRSGSAGIVASAATGRPVTAADAVSMGLASALADRHERDRIVGELSRADPRGLAGIASLARRGAGLGARQAEALERAVFSWCFAAGEPAEAIRSYRGVGGGRRAPGEA